MSLVSAIRSTQLLNCTSAIVLELQEKTIQYSHQSRLQTGELHELLRKPMNIHHVLQTCPMITGGGGIPPLPAHAQTVDTRPYLFSSIGLGTRLVETGLAQARPRGRAFQTLSSAVPSKNDRRKTYTAHLCTADRRSCHRF